PVRVEMPGGRSVIRVVEVSIDEATLQRIASRTGGQYFRATDNASLAKIYGEIDRLERTEIEQEQFTEYRQYYAWFVVGAMAVLTLALVLRGTLLRRLP
ncbi:MAG: aerotolerance regulator BatA, partial [Kofleriaceae bacterium]